MGKKIWNESKFVFARTNIYLLTERIVYRSLRVLWWFRAGVWVGLVLLSVSCTKWKSRLRNIVHAHLNAMESGWTAAWFMNAELKKKGCSSNCVMFYSLSKISQHPVFDKRIFILCECLTFFTSNGAKLQMKYLFCFDVDYILLT